MLARLGVGFRGKGPVVAPGMIDSSRSGNKKARQCRALSEPRERGLFRGFAAGRARAIHQFNVGHRRIVTRAESALENAQIAARAL